MGLKSHERLEYGDIKMWFDANLRFQLCEAGISGFVDIPPIKVLHGRAGRAQIPVCFSGNSGFVPGWK